MQARDKRRGKDLRRCRNVGQLRIRWPEINVVGGGGQGHCQNKGDQADQWEIICSHAGILLVRLVPTIRRDSLTTDAESNHPERVEGRCGRTEDQGLQPVGYPAMLLSTIL